MMDQILDQENIEDKKVYEEAAILFGTFMGGPIVAGYFISENFKALNYRLKAINTWRIAIPITILVAILIVIIPESLNIPDTLIPIIYTASAYFLYKKYQSKDVNDLMQKGGISQNWLKIVAATLIGFIITALLIIGIFFLYDIVLSQN